MRPRHGSSPHTRGAPESAYSGDDHVRIIPAYAGSTSRRRQARGPTADHPRIRGEHVTTFSAILSAPGSSPHTRGAQGPRVQGGVLRGIIPAYAGSTLAGASSRHWNRDHPRIRGEHATVKAHRRQDNGSSPHTRGARRYRGRGAAFHRIIPAYAGSTQECLQGDRANEDHPRIRGEHSRGPAGRSTTRGSSPHTRGARHHHRHRLSAVGIIPAYAGSTSSKSAPT